MTSSSFCESDSAYLYARNDNTGCANDKAWLEWDNSVWLNMPYDSVTCAGGGNQGNCANGYVFERFSRFDVCYEPGVFESQPQLRSILTKELEYISYGSFPSKALDQLHDMKYYLNIDYKVSLEDKAN